MPGARRRQSTSSARSATSPLGWLPPPMATASTAVRRRIALRWRTAAGPTCPSIRRAAPWRPPPPMPPRGPNMPIDAAAGAMAAITAIAAAIDKLGAAQATIGKGENQLTYAVNLAQSQITNFSAAESQIRDANVAQQAANLSKA